MNSTFLIYSFTITAYIAITILIGIKIKNSGFNNLREWALEKSTVGWFGLAMTAFATLYSAFTYVGMPGYYHKHGIGTLLIITLPCCTLTCLLFYIVGLRMVKINHEHKAVTPFEIFIIKVKNTGIPKWFLGACILALIFFNFPYIIIQIAGVSKVLSSLSNDTISYPIAAFFMLVSIYIYADFGGMKGIIITDIFQGIYGIVMISILSFFFLQTEWDGSLTKLFLSLKRNHPEHMTLPGTKGLFTPGFIITQFFVIGSLSIAMIQMFSRTLLFKTKSHVAKTSALLFVSSILIGFFAIIIGLGALEAYPTLVDSDLAIVEVIKHSPLTLLFGDIIGALFLIGILAGAMSTADSVLFSLGTVFVVNGVQSFKKQKISEKQQKKIIKIFILVFLTISYLIALQPPTLILDLSLVGLSGVSILAPSFLFLLWKKVPQNILVIGLTLGYSSFVIVQWIIPSSNLFGLGSGAYGMGLNTLVLLGWMSKKHLS